MIEGAGVRRYVIRKGPPKIIFKKLVNKNAIKHERVNPAPPPLNFVPKPKHGTL
jgi:hypothetical protein